VEKAGMLVTYARTPGLCKSLVAQEQRQTEGKQTRALPVPTSPIADNGTQQDVFKTS